MGVLRETLVVMLVVLWCMGCFEAVEEIEEEEWGEEEGGLSVDYYNDSCPEAYAIVRERVVRYVSQDPAEAAGLLRILFHDCFVQGCDASILLEGNEETSLPNAHSLRPSSLYIIDDIKQHLEASCQETVSCADIIALAAKEAVYLVGGPYIPIETGRKDSCSAASNQTVLASLPPPTFGFFELKNLFTSHGLNLHDLVALSGGHSIGDAHCKVVDAQIFPKSSNDLDPNFATNLMRICSPPTLNLQKEIPLDPITPNRFDNNYYRNILAQRVVFHSDAALLDDPHSQKLVEKYAESEEKFFKQFRKSILRLSRIGVLIGKEGNVRQKCPIRHASCGI